MKTQITNVALVGGIDAKTSEPWSDKPNSLVNVRYTKTGSLTKRRSMRRGDFSPTDDPVRDFQLYSKNPEERLEVTTTGKLQRHGLHGAYDNVVFNAHPESIVDVGVGGIVEDPVVEVSAIEGHDLACDTCLIDTVSLNPFYSDYCVEAIAYNFKDGIGNEDWQSELFFYKLDKHGKKELRKHVKYKDPNTTGGAYVARVRIEYCGIHPIDNIPILALTVLSNGVIVSFFEVDADFIPTTLATVYPQVSTVAHGNLPSVSSCPFDVYTVKNPTYQFHLLMGVGGIGGVGGIREYVYNPVNGASIRTGMIVSDPTSTNYEVTAVSIHGRGSTAANTTLVWSAIAYHAVYADVTDHMYFLGGAYAATGAVTAQPMLSTVIKDGAINRWVGTTTTVATYYDSGGAGKTYRLYNTVAGVDVVSGGDLSTSSNIYHKYQNLHAIGRPFYTKLGGTLAGGLTYPNHESLQVPMCTLSNPYYGTGLFVKLPGYFEPALGKTDLKGVFLVDGVPLKQLLPADAKLTPTNEIRNVSNFMAVNGPARGHVWKLLTTEEPLHEYFYGFICASVNITAPMATSIYKFVDLDLPAHFSSAGSVTENCVNVYAQSANDDAGEIGFVCPGAMLGGEKVTPSAGFPYSIPTGVYQYVAVFSSVGIDGREVQSVPSLPMVFDNNEALKTPRVYYSAYSATLRGCNSSVRIATTDPPNFQSNFVDIYRTKVGEATFYFHSRRPATEFYTAFYKDGIFFDDILKDQELDATRSLNAGKFWQTPPNFKFSVHVNNRIFGVTYSGQVWPSATITLSEAPRFDISTAFYWDGAPLTAISYLDGKYIFFTENTVSYAMEDQTGTLVSLQLIPCDVGCDNPRSVIACPFGVFFQNVETRTILLLSRSMEIVRIGERLPQPVRLLKVTATCLNAAYGEVYFFLTRGVPENTPDAGTERVEETGEWAIVFDYFHGDVKNPVWVLDRYFKDDMTIRPITEITRAYAFNTGIMRMLGDANLNNLSNDNRHCNGYFTYGIFDGTWMNWDACTEGSTYASWIGFVYDSSFTRGPQTPSDNLSVLSASAVLSGTTPPDQGVSLTLVGDYPQTPATNLPYGGTVLPLTHTSNWDNIELKKIQRFQLLITTTPEISQSPAVQVQYRDKGPTLFGGALSSNGIGFELLAVTIRWGVRQTDDVLGLEAGARK